MKKRITAIILMLVLFSGVFVFSGAAAEHEPDQVAALTAYEKLWNSFAKDETGLTAIYPDEYGGAFIDNNILCIYIVDLNKDLERKYQSLTGYADCVMYIDADYSLNYLESLNILVDNCVNIYNIAGYGVDIIANRFLINILPAFTAKDYFNPCRNYSEDDTINAIKGIIQSDALIFESSGMNVLNTNLVGGDKLNNSFSMCISGTFTGTGTNGQYYSNASAILTAGHCVTINDGSNTRNVQYIKYNTESTSFAETVFWDYQDGGAGDYAIAVISNNNYITTNQIHYSSMQNSINITSTTHSGGAPVGTTVYCFGSTTQSRLICTISQYNYSAVYYPNPLDPSEYFTVNGLVRALFSSTTTQNGDSGGPVYIQTGTGSYSLVGDISGKTGPAYSQIYTYLIYSPIYYPEYYGFTVKTS